jgi:hypothetical protein
VIVCYYFIYRVFISIRAAERALTLCFLPIRFAFFVSLLVYFVAPLAQSLKITSKSAGAKVELDGVPADTTPFEKISPGGYFHRLAPAGPTASISSACLHSWPALATDS